MNGIQVAIALVVLVGSGYAILCTFVHKAKRRARQLEELNYVDRMGRDPAIGSPDTLREAIFDGMNDRQAVVPGIHDSGDVVEIHVRNFLCQGFNAALLRATTVNERDAIRALAVRVGIMKRDKE